MDVNLKNHVENNPLIKPSFDPRHTQSTPQPCNGCGPKGSNPLLGSKRHSFVKVPAPKEEGDGPRIILALALGAVRENSLIG